MPATFLIVPQWQGSASSRAMRLIDGAEAIAGDLPTAASIRIPVPLGAGESLQTRLRRYSSLAETYATTRDALAQASGPVILIGGDDGSDLAAIARAAATHDDLAVLRFGAHARLRDPAGAAERCLDEVSARAMLGDGPDPLAATAEERVDAARLLLVGTRSLEDDESEYLGEAGIGMLAADSTPDAVAERAAHTGAGSIYLHVELDVLDPAEILSIDSPEPFGMALPQLCDALRELRRRFDFVGAAITGFAPADAESAERDLPVILRILGALTGPLG